MKIKNLEHLDNIAHQNQDADLVRGGITAQAWVNAYAESKGWYGSAVTSGVASTVTVSYSPYWKK